MGEAEAGHSSVSKIVPEVKERLGLHTVAGVHAENARYGRDGEEDDGDDGEGKDGQLLPVFGHVDLVRVLALLSAPAHPREVKSGQPTSCSRSSA